MKTWLIALAAFVAGSLLVRSRWPRRRASSIASLTARSAEDASDRSHVTVNAATSPTSRPNSIQEAEIDIDNAPTNR